LAIRRSAESRFGRGLAAAISSDLVSDSGALVDSAGLVGLIASIVRDGRTDAPLHGVDFAMLTSLAAEHGVLPLVADALGSRSDVPERWRTSLAQHALATAALDAMREGELRRLLAAWRAAGLQALLMKGAALAYTHYARPDLRVRLDTDVLIAVSERDRATAILADLGYEQLPQVEGDLVMYQSAFRRSSQGAAIHTVDLHWRLANPQAFGDVLRFDEAWAASRPVAGLGPDARALGDVHALVVACVHRVAHHGDSPELIWLYDIHLLASTLETKEWTEFWRFARQKGIGAVCAHSLRMASARFDTTLGDDAAGSDARGEAATARYLRRRRHAADVLADLRSLPGWGARLRLLRQHVLPSSRYMRDIYAPGSVMPLPVLYVVRAARGAIKWLSRG
jgi:hypothetical protein